MRIVMLTVAVAMAAVGEATAKTEPTLVTRQEIANARRNVARYDWAKEILERQKKACADWVKQDDETLWRLVPDQRIARGIHLNSDVGCPKCGRGCYKFGNYPWKWDSWERPWKIECPNCGVILPTNDWTAFWNSGRGADGRFDPAKADRRLLFNTEHPDPKDPLHMWGVTDGTGFIDEDGNRFWIIGYYCHWYWYAIISAVDAMSEVYALSGDATYGHKCLVLLDRIADLYPEMDLRPYGEQGYYNSDGGSKRGRIVGRIWECGQMTKLVGAYDRVYDAAENDPEFVAFLSGKAKAAGLANDKSSPAAIRKNIEDGLIREVIRGVCEGDIQGNAGMHQTTMAYAAICLDDPVETPNALGWIFSPSGGALPRILVELVDRDGVGSEGAPGYSLGWTSWLGPCAKALNRYRKWDGPDPVRDYPQFANMHKSSYLMTSLDKYTPHIGDTGSTGNPGMVNVSAALYFEAWRLFGDPLYGRIAWRLNGNSAAGLRGGVYDAEPEAEAARLQEAVRGLSEFALTSNNLNGYGLATLRAGKGANQRAVWLYYGRNIGHGHSDRLNWGMFYKGTDVTPDLGYPEYADGKWPKRGMWTNNTISHNTVIVDARKQDGNWGGHCRDFTDMGWARMADVSSPNAYGIEEYRRTLVMVDADEEDSYVVDVFRCAGGRDHVMSFHAAAGEMSAEGIEFVAQDGGSYAGADIPFKKGYDGPEDGSYRGSGFSWLHDVARAKNPKPGWAVEYDMVDTWKTFPEGADMRLRCDFLSPVDEAARALGDPPDNKPGNPKNLNYVLNSRSGENLRSVFLSVIEAYAFPSRKVKSVERIDMGLDPHDFAAIGVKATLQDGRVDYILLADDGSKAWRLGEGIEVAGRCAVVRMKDGRPEKACGVGILRIRIGETILNPALTVCTGSIMEFERDATKPAWIDADVSLPKGSALAGRMLRVFNDGERDACYEIERIETTPGGSRIHLGRVALVRGFKDRSDYTKGYVYDVSKGNLFEIALASAWTFDENGCVKSWKTNNGSGGR
ncbi:MAG TPA: heparinase II/III family protein [Candidatus Brocadiia bacterium]|nr:heparinase II/III family protein [Candidatus Brocadiia bacterium]